MMLVVDALLRWVGLRSCVRECCVGVGFWKLGIKSFDIGMTGFGVADVG